MRTLLSLIALQLKFQQSASFSIASSPTVVSSTVAASAASASCSSRTLFRTRSKITTTTITSRNMSAEATSTSKSTTMKKSMVVDPFCFRQFAEHEASKSYGGTVFSNSMAEFETIVNERFDEQNLVDGYAPFCKHIFLLNDFTNAKVNILPITPDNEQFLRSTYERRNEKELPVLTRSFPSSLLKDVELPKAQYLDLILYSREQIQKENEAMDKDKDYADGVSDIPWGIVSIKAQDVDYEIPMTPITAMRNALGKEEGGSGVPLDRESYLKAYEFWNTHATIS